jgi:hypothetical protein
MERFNHAPFSALDQRLISCSNEDNNPIKNLEVHEIHGIYSTRYSDKRHEEEFGKPLFILGRTPVRRLQFRTEFQGELAPIFIESTRSRMIQFVTENKQQIGGEEGVNNT